MRDSIEKKPARLKPTGRDSRIPRRFAPIAQLVEHLTLNQQVLGSTPSGGTLLAFLLQVAAINDAETS